METDGAVKEKQSNTPVKATNMDLETQIRECQQQLKLLQLQQAAVQ